MRKPIQLVYNPYFRSRWCCISNYHIEILYCLVAIAIDCPTLYWRSPQFIILPKKASKLPLNLHRLPQSVRTLDLKDSAKRLYRILCCRRLNSQLRLNLTTIIHILILAMRRSCHFSAGLDWEDIFHLLLPEILFSYIQYI